MANNKNVFFEFVSGIMFDNNTFFLKDRATEDWKKSSSADFGRKCVFKMWATSIKGTQTKN